MRTALLTQCQTAAEQFAAQKGHQSQDLAALALPGGSRQMNVFGEIGFPKPSFPQ